MAHETQPVLAFFAGVFMTQVWNRAINNPPPPPPPQLPPAT